MFNNDDVNLGILRERAYNLRWATVPDGVIPLTAADPDFPCAPEISESIMRFSKDNYFSYGPPEGLPGFKESMAMYFQTKRKISATPDLLFPVDSAAFGIYVTCKAFLTVSDQAIIFDPVDYLFRYSIEAVGAKAIPFSILSNSIIDFDLLETLINSKTRMLCLCNPINPNGKVFTKDELLKFGQIACKYNLIILSDEIWSDIVYTPSLFTSIASLNKEINNRTITVTGFSKSYGLAGLRIGAVLAPNILYYKKLFEASMHNSTIHGANILGQVAATAALTKCEYWLNEFIQHLLQIRDMFVKRLNTIKGFKCIAPQGTYVAFVDITGTNKNSVEISELLFNKAKVAVVPGLRQWFGTGANGYIRLCFATSDVILNDAATRIETIINLL